MPVFNPQNLGQQIRDQVIAGLPEWIQQRMRSRRQAPRRRHPARRNHDVYSAKAQEYYRALAARGGQQPASQPSSQNRDTYSPQAQEFYRALAARGQQPAQPQGLPQPHIDPEGFKNALLARIKDRIGQRNTGAPFMQGFLQNYQQRFGQNPGLENLGQQISQRVRSRLGR